MAVCVGRSPGAGHSVPGPGHVRWRHLPPDGGAGTCVLQAEAPDARQAGHDGAHAQPQRQPPSPSHEPPQPVGHPHAGAFRLHRPH